MIFDSESTLQSKRLSLISLTVFSVIIRFISLNHIPPGLWFDEAWVAVVARDWGNEIYYPATWGGMHPGIVYLTKLGYLFSNHPLTIRYVVAAVGTLTVPLAYVSTRPLFRLAKFKDPDWPSLITATILSITYPFFHFSRLGFESILPAPFALVTFGLCAWLIQRQLSKPKWGDPVAFALGGWLGLTIYTFDTARFIPIAMALAFCLVWFSHRKTWSLPDAVASLTLVTLVAIVVAAPLLRYFWLNWDTFIQRAEVTTFNTLGAGAASVPLALINNTVRTFGGLVVSGWGDELTRHNLPGRPVFDLILSILLLIGAYRLFAKKNHTLTLIVLPWLIVTLLPVILTDNAPTYTSMFGAIPALAIIVAIGCWHVLELLPKNRSWAIPLLLFASALWTCYDYFVRWPVDPAYFNDFKTVEWDIADRALAEQDTGAVFFTPRREYLKDPTYDLLFANSDIRPLINGSCVQYRADETVTYVLGKDKGKSETELEALQNSLGATDILSVEDIFYRSTNDIIGQVARVKVSPPAVSHIPPISFGQSIQLIGQQELKPTYLAGERIELAFHWQTTKETVPHNYLMFAHMYAADDVSTPLAQFDGPPCVDTSTWVDGDILIDRRHLLLPTDLPADDYLIAIGWYHPFSFERLELTGSQLSDNRLPFAEFSIE